MKQRIVGTAVLSLCAAIAGATEFYVSSTASTSGNGTLANPWKLSKALSHPSAVQPGDTIWLRGGTYTGVFVSDLSGTASSPIIVRAFPGERVTLDGGDSNGIAILIVRGSHAWFWGFEIMSSDLKRQSSQSGPWPTDIERGDGVASGPLASVGLKFINLAVHDTRQGFSAFSAWSDTEIYGCLVYYNGWDGPDNGHGHGIYTQNQTGYKRISDSVIFHQFSHGIHAYGSDAAYLNNYAVDGNTVFMNGDIASHGTARNILLGGSVVTNNPILTNNALYFDSGPPTSDFDLGYTAGCQNASVIGNYIATNTYMPACDPVAMTGNTYYGNIDGFSQSQYPNNTYYSSRPTGSKILIRPNQYEPGRATITVYNWDLLDSVSVDLASLLTVGTAFEIRNAQNFFGAPVVSGIYAGGAISIPTADLPIASPVGFATPPPTGREFNVFVLTSTAGPFEFFDVLPSNPFHDDVRTVAESGITAGCAPGYYCPLAPVTRAQMAVLLLKSRYGSAYTPPSATGGVFVDVAPSAFAAAWIEQLAAENLTTGCGGGRYRPGASVTRAQMAVLLLKAKEGEAYAPPSATGTVFLDVPASAFAASWIEELSSREITAGCGAGRYCPGASVNRGQMATFLTRTFSLP